MPNYQAKTTEMSLSRMIASYLNYPKNQPVTAMDWRALGGDFLERITYAAYNPNLYGVSDDLVGVESMQRKGFVRASQSGYLSESKISNDAFSLITIEPTLDRRVSATINSTVDPYIMPDFRNEIRLKVLADEEKRKRLLEQTQDQIDLSQYANLTDKPEEQVLETEEERSERLEKKMRMELQSRVREWRVAMKEEQRDLMPYRHDQLMLQRSSNYLKPGGVLVFITPKELIDDSIAFKLVNQFENIKILRLPDAEYLDKRKCVIIATKRAKTRRDQNELAKLIARTKERPYTSFGVVRELSVEPTDPSYEKQLLRQQVDKMYGVLSEQEEGIVNVPVGVAEEVSLFRVGPITAIEVTNVLSKSKLIGNYQEQNTQVQSIRNPVTPTPLHKGHIMLLLTSGLLNGYIGSGPDQHLVKGTAIKGIKESIEIDDEGEERIVEREFYNIGVKLLDGRGNFRRIM